MPSSAVLSLWRGFYLLAIFLGTTSDEPEAAALVRQARQLESWIDRVESIRLKALVLWECTPARSRIPAP